MGDNTPRWRWITGIGLTYAQYLDRSIAIHEVVDLILCALLWPLLVIGVGLLYYAVWLAIPALRAAC